MQVTEFNCSTGETIVRDLTPFEIAEQARMERENAEAIAAIPYDQKRAAAYPDFRDYLDGIVKGDQAQVQAYINACLAVKAMFPKP